MSNVNKVYHVGGAYLWSFFGHFYHHYFLVLIVINPPISDQIYLKLFGNCHCDSKLGLTQSAIRFPLLCTFKLRKENSKKQRRGNFRSEVTRGQLVTKYLVSVSVLDSLLMSFVDMATKRDSHLNDDTTFHTSRILPLHYFRSRAHRIL